jgi:hypothetical protein
MNEHHYDDVNETRVFIYRHCQHVHRWQSAEKRTEHVRVTVDSPQCIFATAEKDRVFICTRCQ